MAWYVSVFRETAEGGRTVSHVVGPDGVELGGVPRDERGKPLDSNKPARERQAGIVWSQRGKKSRSGHDHYWVMGSGRQFLIVVEDVTNGGQRICRVEQMPQHLTDLQTPVLQRFGLFSGGTLAREDADAAE